MYLADEPSTHRPTVFGRHHNETTESSEQKRSESDSKPIRAIKGMSAIGLKQKMKLVGSLKEDREEETRT